MPCIVTSIHDLSALTATCQRLGLERPIEGTVQYESGDVFGWVIRLPGVRYPLVCNLLTGLVMYHSADNVPYRYASIMRFIFRVYSFKPLCRSDSRRPLPFRGNGSAQHRAVHGAAV